MKELLFSNRVVACYDDVKKGACKRKDCKFYHPPNHLKNVVHTNGRNNLRMRYNNHHHGNPFRCYSGERETLVIGLNVSVVRRNELKQQIDAMYGGGPALAQAPMYCGYMSYPAYTQHSPVTYSAPPALLPGLGAASDPGLVSESGHQGYPGASRPAKTVNTPLEKATSAKYHPYIMGQGDRRPGHNTGAKMRLAGDLVYPGLTGHVSQGLTGHLSPASDLLMRYPSGPAAGGYPGPLMSLGQPLVYLAPPGETQMSQAIASGWSIPTVTTVRENTADNAGQAQL